MAQSWCVATTLFFLILTQEIKCHDTQSAVEVGKAEYELISRDARMPVYGECWKRALNDLERGCQSLTDDKQTRLALSFANCFLSMSGQQTYPCDPSEEVSKCLKSIDGKAFSAFSNFFTHTHNMCQFLQSQVWNEETQNTINRLTEDSAKVAESLSRWSELQDTILENQMTTLEYQKEIMANGSALSLALESSRENAKQLMEEFRTSTDEQRALIFSIFDRVSKLQSLVVSEVSWFYTVIFYAGTLVLVYVMTATRRTADSRFSLLFIFTLNAVVERVICSMSLVGIDNPSATMFFPENGMESLPEVISNRIWLSRKISLLSATILVVYNVWNFKDYNMINNAILKDIQMQNKELRNALQAIRASNETLLTDTTDSKAICTVDSDSDSDTLSFNSTQTDRTWMLTHEPSDDDDDVTDIEDDFLDDVLSAENSGNGSITDMSIMQQPVSIVGNVSSDNSLATQKKLGRPKGSRSSTPRRSLTPQLPVNHGYNLRNRSLMNHTMNPILETETPEVFARRVLEVAASAEQNRHDFCHTVSQATRKKKT